MKTYIESNLPAGVRPFLRTKLLLILALALAGVATGRSQAIFTPLGDFGGGPFESFGYSTTPSGNMVVGFGTTSNGFQAYCWTPGNGLEGIGYLPGGQSHSAAFGANGAGNIIVGEGRNNSNFEAFRWSGGTMTGLGVLAGHVVSAAYAVNDDGSVVVGYSAPANGIERAFRWTSGGGMVDLGSLGGVGYSLCYAVCADGNTAVGYSSVASGQEAFRWTLGGGMQSIGVLPGGILHESSAQGISADGNVIVGYSWSAAGQQAFRWTESGGMIGLGDLAGGGTFSVANAANADGSIIVGAGDTEDGTEAFIWDSVNGMQRLEDYVVSLGATNLSGWLLQDATGISADGLTISGTGINPFGDTEAFVVVVPEPSTTALAGLGALGMGFFAWRQRRSC